MEEKIVQTQADFDAIPDNYQGRIKVYGRGIAITRRFICRVEAWGNSSVVAWGNSSVVAWGNSSVVARENSSVEAWENSSVEAWGNSSVVARGNSQVVARQAAFKIKTNGNARIVYMPKNAKEALDFWGVKHTKTCATLYKAVHKKNDKYFSDYDKDFEYKIGEKLSNDCDSNLDKECSTGLHVAYLAWVVNFGRNWNDLAILEVKVKIDDLVFPTDSNGKMRTKELKVIREVPLEECGVLGKIIAERKERL